MQCTLQDNNFSVLPHESFKVTQYHKKVSHNYLIYTTPYKNTVTNTINTTYNVRAGHNISVTIHGTKVACIVIPLSLQGLLYSDSRLYYIFLWYGINSITKKLHFKSFHWLSHHGTFVHVHWIHV